MLLLGKGENSIYEIIQDLNATYPELKKYRSSPTCVTGKE